MISNCKLPFAFDPTLLKADLQQIMPDEWVGHFNTGYYEGQWTGVALRSVGGVSTKLYPDPTATGPFADTAILDRCPTLRDVLTTFKCPLLTVRLLKLAAGSIIREHRDYNLGYEDGEIRLHIPVTTNADVEFFLDGHRIEMHEGECWYLNFNLPHRVRNRGATDRIHLVIDCLVDDWLRQLLRSLDLEILEQIEQPFVVGSSDSRGGWQTFHESVLRDPNLQCRLRDTDDLQSFVKLVTTIGTEAGYRFTAADVEEALQTARRLWNEEWIA
jgi:hypothetical protein